MYAIKILNKKWCLTGHMYALPLLNQQCVDIARNTTVAMHHPFTPMQYIYGTESIMYTVCSTGVCDFVGLCVGALKGK